MSGDKGLVRIIASGILISAIGVAAIKGCMDSHYNSLPGVVYMVHGKKVLERRFKTNEEFERYINSEQGKKEQEYYMNLNNRK